MQQRNRKGFTLIELLIVVVIIGILAAIAIPKFAATKDKAKLSSVKTDVRNLMSMMEGLASDSGKYVTPTSGSYSVTVGNTEVVTPAGTGNGYTISVENESITSGAKKCTVLVGSSATDPKDDGVIKCS